MKKFFKIEVIIAIILAILSILCCVADYIAMGLNFDYLFWVPELLLLFSILGCYLNYSYYLFITDKLISQKVEEIKSSCEEVKLISKKEKHFLSCDEHDNNIYRQEHDKLWESLKNHKF